MSDRRGTVEIPRGVYYEVPGTRRSKSVILIFIIFSFRVLWFVNFRHVRTSAYSRLQPISDIYVHLAVAAHSGLHLPPGGGVPAI